MALPTVAAGMDKLNGGAPASAPSAPPPVDNGTVSFDGDGEMIADVPASEPAAPPTPIEKPAATKQPKFTQLPELDVKKEFGKEEETAGEEKPVAAPTEETPAAPEARDYSAYDPEVAAIGKHLRNKQFKELLPQIQQWKKEAAEAKTLREQPREPQFSYENENAYLMDKNYQETSRLANLANFEVEHLTRQLELIESGEDWYELTGYDQQGQPRYIKHDARTDGKIDSGAKARVLGLLTQTQNATNVAAQRLQGIQQQYKQNAAQAVQELRAVETRLMPNIVPEKFTPEEKEWFEFAGTQSPTRFKGHPLVHTHQLMFVAYMRLLNAAKSLEERAMKAEKTLESAKAAGPIIRHGVTPRAAKDDDVIVNASDFD